MQSLGSHGVFSDKYWVMYSQTCLISVRMVLPAFIQCRALLILLPTFTLLSISSSHFPFLVDMLPKYRNLFIWYTCSSPTIMCWSLSKPINIRLLLNLKVTQRFTHQIKKKLKTLFEEWQNCVDAAPCVWCQLIKRFSTEKQKNKHNMISYPLIEL